MSTRGIISHKALKENYGATLDVVDDPTSKTNCKWAINVPVYKNEVLSGKYLEDKVIRLCKQLAYFEYSMTNDTSNLSFKDFHFDVYRIDEVFEYTIDMYDVDKLLSSLPNYKEEVNND